MRAREAAKRAVQRHENAVRLDAGDDAVRRRPARARRVLHRRDYVQIAVEDRLLPRHRGSGSRDVHGEHAEVQARARTNLGVRRAPRDVADVMRRQQRLDPGRELDHRAVGFDGDHLALHFHPGRQLVEREKRLLDDRFLTRRRRDAVDDAPADHARADGRAHLELLLQTLDVIVRRVGDVHVSQARAFRRRIRLFAHTTLIVRGRGRRAGRRKLEQDADVRVHASNDRGVVRGPRFRQVQVREGIAASLGRRRLRAVPYERKSGWS